MPSVKRSGRGVSPWGGSVRGAIGILGGSFNPAHDGHLHISQEALRRLKLRQVWWLVSPQNPLKSVRGMAALPDRVEAARRIARDPRIQVTDLEADLRSHYTVDTLRLLKRRFPRARFVWLMGADNMVQVSRWHRWTGLFQTVPVAVFDRDTYAKKAVTGVAARRFARNRVVGRRVSGLAGQSAPAWAFLPIRRHPASATDLRDRGQWP